eukprot:g15944.t1
MVRAAMLLLHFHLPKVFAFKYEFAKDPVPLQSSYWMLGQITVAAPSRPSSAASSASTSTNGGSPEVSIDLKTSVDNAAAIESITSKLGNVQVGFAPDYVFAKMDEKSRFCCTEADQCEGGAGTFSVTSKRHMGGNAAVYAATLKEAGPVKFKPVPGSYYLWIANCADSGLAGLKVSGSASVKQADGWVRPEERTCQDISKYCGIAALVFSVLYGGYAAFSSVSSREGSTVKYWLSFAAFLGALRLLLGSGYYYSSWNATGVEGSGCLPYILLAAMQICASATLYEFLCSQHFFTAYNSVKGGDDSSILVSSGKNQTTLQEWLLLCFANMALFAVFVFLLADSFTVQTRPPPAFFDYASGSGQRSAAGGEGKEVAGATSEDLFLGLEKSDWVLMATLVLIVYPVMVFLERKDGVIVNDFTTKIFWPLRRLVVTLFATVVALQMLLQYVSSTFTSSSSSGIMAASDGSLIAAQMEASTRCASLEVAALIAYLATAVSLKSWDSLTAGSGSYTVVSEKDLELAQMETEIDAEVEDYDPDEIAEKRQLE